MCSANEHFAPNRETARDRYHQVVRQKEATVLFRSSVHPYWHHQFIGSLLSMMHDGTKSFFKSWSSKVAKHVTSYLKRENLHNPKRSKNLFFHLLHWILLLYLHLTLLLYYRIQHRMRHHYLHSPLQLNTAWELNVDSPSKTVACSLLSQSRWKWDAEKEKQGGKGKNNLALYLDSRVKYCGHTREKFLFYAATHTNIIEKWRSWFFEFRAIPDALRMCILMEFRGARCSWRMTDWMLDQNSTVHAILMTICLVDWAR